MQLDLFLHSHDVMLRNDAIAALRRRDPPGVGAALEALAKEYAGDPLLPPLETLRNALLQQPARLASCADALSALTTMENELARAAHAVFGGREAREWLRPVWRRLADAACGLRFDPRAAEAHPAYMLLRAEEWEKAESLVLEIPSWRRIPAPLAWAAEARHGRSGLDAAWTLLAELAWIDPDRFGTLARRLDSALLVRLLAGFEAGFESEGECDFAWFPAWVLIEEPGLASLLRETESGQGEAPERAARLVMSLLSLERQGRHAELVRERKRLRELHAGLFARYMATR
jgi:hypothetical protein